MNPNGFFVAYRLEFIDRPAGLQYCWRPGAPVYTLDLRAPKTRSMGSIHVGLYYGAIVLQVRKSGTMLRSVLRSE